MKPNRHILFLAGAALLAGCGAEDLPPIDVPPSEEAPVQEPSVAFCNSISTWNSEWMDFESQVLTLVNQKRAKGAVCRGVSMPPVPAVALDTKLRCAARKHSKDMGDNNFFAHTGSDGSTPWQRTTSAGYTHSSMGENIAITAFSSPSEAVAAWLSSSKGHCELLMGAHFQHLGVGYYHLPDRPHFHYWTQEFGSPKARP